MTRTVTIACTALGVCVAAAAAAQEGNATQPQESPRKQPTGSASQPADDARQFLDVPYVEADGVPPRLLSLDIFTPRTGAEHAVVVMIHGGGWRMGDKAGPGMRRYKVPHFTGSGYVYVSINYRLSPAVKHPTHAQDVANALAWVHQHIGEYGGDPQKIFVMGHSAGAHLAALVATDERYLQAAGADLQILEGVVLLDGAAYDIPNTMRAYRPAPELRKLYELAFGTNKQGWRDASPLYHVAIDKHIPPFLIFHAGRRVESAAQSRILAAALNACDVPARAVHAPEKNHAAMNRDVGRPGDAPTRLIMEFLHGADPRTLPASTETDG